MPVAMPFIRIMTWVGTGLIAVIAAVNIEEERNDPAAVDWVAWEAGLFVAFWVTYATTLRLRAAALADRIRWTQWLLAVLLAAQC